MENRSGGSRCNYSDSTSKPRTGSPARTAGVNQERNQRNTPNPNNENVQTPTGSTSNKDHRNRPSPSSSMSPTEDQAECTALPRESYENAIRSLLSWFNPPNISRSHSAITRARNLLTKDEVRLLDLQKKNGRELQRIGYQTAIEHYESNSLELDQCLEQIQNDYKTFRVHPLQAERKDFVEFIQNVSSVRLREFIKNLRTTVIAAAGPSKGHSQGFNDTQKLPSVHQIFFNNGKTVEQLLKCKSTTLQELLPDKILEEFESSSRQQTEDEEKLATLFADSTRPNYSYDLATFKTQLDSFPWNPVHCHLPYLVFVALSDKMTKLKEAEEAEKKKKETSSGGASASASFFKPSPIRVSHNIYKFRYLEYMHKLESTSDQQFLLSLVHTYGVDILHYPAKVFQFLYERNLLKGLPKMDRFSVFVATENQQKQKQQQQQGPIGTENATKSKSSSAQPAGKDVDDDIEFLEIKASTSSSTSTRPLLAPATAPTPKTPNAQDVEKDGTQNSGESSVTKRKASPIVKDPRKQPAPKKAGGGTGFFVNRMTMNTPIVPGRPGTGAKDIPKLPNSATNRLATGPRGGQKPTKGFIIGGTGMASLEAIQILSTSPPVKKLISPGLRDSTVKTTAKETVPAPVPERSKLLDVVHIKAIPDRQTPPSRENSSSPSLLQVQTPAPTYHEPANSIPVLVGGQHTHTNKTPNNSIKSGQNNNSSLSPTKNQPQPVFPDKKASPQKKPESEPPINAVMAQQKSVQPVAGPAPVPAPTTKILATVTKGPAHATASTTSSKAKTTSVPESSITFEEEKMSDLKQAYIKWYYGSDAPTTSSTTIDTSDWYPKILAHITRNQAALTACLQQLLEDHSLSCIEIPKQHFSPSSTNKISLPGASRQTQLKSRSTTVQKELINESQLFKREGTAGSSSSAAEEDLWNPFNLSFSFKVFEKHFDWFYSSMYSGRSLIHNDEIIQLRYLEYMNSVTMGQSHAFLLAVLTALDTKIETYPLRIIQFLQQRKLFLPRSRFLEEDMGPPTRCYSDIMVRDHFGNVLSKKLSFVQEASVRQVEDDDSDENWDIEEISNPVFKNVGQQQQQEEEESDSDEDWDAATVEIAKELDDDWGKAQIVGSDAQNANNNAGTSSRSRTTGILGTRKSTTVTARIPGLDLVEENEEIDNQREKGEIDFVDLEPDDDNYDDAGAGAGTECGGDGAGERKESAIQSKSCETGQTGTVTAVGMVEGEDEEAIVEIPETALNYKRLCEEGSMELMEYQSRFKKMRQEDIPEPNLPPDGYEKADTDISRVRIFRDKMAQIPLEKENTPENVPEGRDNVVRDQPQEADQVDFHDPRGPPRTRANPRPRLARNSSSRSTSGSGSIQEPPFYEMPFEAWKYICEKTRADLNNLTEGRYPAVTAPLTDSQYRINYVRYVDHIERNFDKFIDGVSTAYPDLAVPDELVILIEHRQRSWLRYLRGLQRRNDDQSGYDEEWSEYESGDRNNDDGDRRRYHRAQSHDGGRRGRGRGRYYRSSNQSNSDEDDGRPYYDRRRSRRGGRGNSEGNRRSHRGGRGRGNRRGNRYRHPRQHSFASRGGFCNGDDREGSYSSDDDRRDRAGSDDGMGRSRHRSRSPNGYRRGYHRGRDQYRRGVGVRRSRRGGRGRSHRQRPDFDGRRRSHYNVNGENWEREFSNSNDENQHHHHEDDHHSKGHKRIYRHGDRDEGRNDGDDEGMSDVSETSSQNNNGGPDRATGRSSQISAPATQADTNPTPPQPVELDQVAESVVQGGPVLDDDAPQSVEMEDLGQVETPQSVSMTDVGQDEEEEGLPVVYDYEHGSIPRIIIEK